MNLESNSQNDELTKEELEAKMLRKAKRKAYYREKRKNRRRAKKIKSFLENLGWILIILAFGFTIYILLKELDLISGNR